VIAGVPLGYLVSTVVTAAFVGFGLWPPSTHGPRATLPYLLGTVSSELYAPMLVCAVAPTALAVAEGDVDLPGDLWALVLPTLSVLGIGLALGRALRTRPVLESALAGGLDVGLRRRRVDVGDVLRVLVAPVRWRRRDVVLLKDLRYGPARGRGNLLDVYVSRTRPAGSPVLVYFHGGGFFSGAKSREARLLLEHLASHGWVCVSANYQLRPAQFPTQVVDAKRVIAWLHAEGPRYGADPGRLVLTGGSAGAHLAMTCALTPGDPRFQPGFEDVDTGVAGAVGFYGYYGKATDEAASSPAHHARPDAPPLLLIHGARDPMAPVEDARAFAAALVAASTGVVLMAELPGGLHAFDLFASIRSASVVAAVEAFGDAVVSGRVGPAPPGLTAPARSGGEGHLVRRGGRVGSRGADGRTIAGATGARRTPPLDDGAGERVPGLHQGVQPEVHPDEVADQ
jgi:acetyl esterase/lipase